MFVKKTFETKLCVFISCNTLTIPSQYPRDTLAIPSRYPRDTLAKPNKHF